MQTLNQLTEFTYPIFITLLHLAGYFFIRAYVKKLQKKRIKSIKKREITDAIETDSPIDDQQEELKDNALEGSQGRFKFILNVLPILLAGLWFISISVPYLGSIPSVYVSIIAAVISVIAGFSLRPFLENLFSGIIITFFRSIKVGDTVHLDEHYGLIEEIGLVYSVIKKWNWVRVVIPNSQLLMKEVLNYTMNDEYVWTHVEFSVSRSTDMKELKASLIDCAKNSEYIDLVEEPSMWVIDIEKDTVKCWLAAWAKNAGEAWELRSDMRLNILEYLNNKGVNGHVFNYQKSNG